MTSIFSRPSRQCVMTFGVFFCEVPTDLWFYLFLYSVFADLQEHSYVSTWVGLFANFEMIRGDDAAVLGRHLEALLEAQIKRFHMQCGVPLLVQHSQNWVGLHLLLLPAVPFRESRLSSVLFLEVVRDAAQGRHERAQIEREHHRIRALGEHAVVEIRRLIEFLLRRDRSTRHLTVEDHNRAMPERLFVLP